MSGPPGDRLAAGMAVNGAGERTILPSDRAQPSRRALPVLQSG